MKVNILFLAILFLSCSSFAQTDYKQVFLQYKQCIITYDDCISDYLFHGLVNMGGDSVKECQEDRVECNKKVEELIKEDK